MSRLTSKEVRSLAEAYNQVYASQESQESLEEQIWEEVEVWVDSLLEEGYDLSDYTWEEMYEAYIEEQLPSTPQVPSLADMVKRGKENEQYKDAFSRASSRLLSGKQLPTQTKDKPNIPPTRTGEGSGSGGVTSPASRPAATGAGSAGKPASASAAAPAAPAAGTKAAGPESIKPKTPNPLLAGGELARMRAASLMRQQGRNLPSGKVPTSADLAPKPTATPTGNPFKGSAATTAVKAATSSPPTTSTASPTANPFKGTAATTAVKAATSSPSTPAATPPKRTTQLFHTDLFDLVKGYLLDEGYADTEEAALAIMSNMSEEWRESIVEKSST